MSALYQRYTPFQSPLYDTKDFHFTIQGFSVVVELNSHSMMRNKDRNIYESVVCLMVQEGFNHILDMKNNQRFILSSAEFDVSIVCVISSVGGEIIVSVVSSIDSKEPRNPHNTIQIAI